MNMFCYQCEQAARGVGCTVSGVCGKGPDVSALNDLVMHAAKAVAMYAHRARKLGVKDREADIAIVEALFTAVTNVNFDSERYVTLIKHLANTRDRLRRLYEDVCTKNGRAPEHLTGPATWQPAATTQGLIKQGLEVDIPKRIEKYGADIAGLEELLTYGLKGIAAYADHAMILGQENDEVYAFFHEALDFLASNPTEASVLLAMIDRAGAINLKVMELLDAANTGAYGHPTPTAVRIEPIEGKAILVSGHDLKDLEVLLRQTEGRNINVYTHCEMLPAHAYPGLKKYKHLIGNYGGAWQDQQKEFALFPGAILMTTNCLQKPLDSYSGRIFTTGLVGWPGIKHIENRNFEPAIEAAIAADGFRQSGQNKAITIGFGHNAVMGVAEKVIDAVKQGAIKHFFLIGGCDGARSGRNYYTEFAEKVPNDCVILTLACGKYRFNKIDFGNIGGIPRLLDCGQCNDAYSAIQIALALSKAFGCGVNDLPLSLILSWYEQKAVCILLTLLHLGIKNMRLGPTLPAFVTPAVLKVLVDKWSIAPITTPTEDLKAILG